MAAECVSISSRSSMPTREKPSVDVEITEHGHMVVDDYLRTFLMRNGGRVDGNRTYRDFAEAFR